MRYNNYHTKKQQEKKESIKEVNEGMLPILAQLKKATLQSQVNTTSDLLPRQKNLKDMDTLNPERIRIINENTSVQRDTKTLSESLTNIDKYYDYLQDNEVTTEEMRELVERLEDTREQTELNAINQLKEDLKDDEY